MVIAPKDNPIDAQSSSCRLESSSDKMEMNMEKKTKRQIMTQSEFVSLPASAVIKHEPWVKQANEKEKKKLNQQK